MNKKTTLVYRITLGLFATCMFGSALPDIVSSHVAVEGFKKMQMPLYLLPFLGIAKTLGVVAILISGYPRIKEWAYAGLIFDLLGATYCVYASSSPVEMAGNLAFMAVPIVTGVLSYIYYHKVLKLNTDINSNNN